MKGRGLYAQILYFIASYIPSTSQLNTVYFEHSCMTCSGNEYTQQPVKINRDGYSSLIEIYILLNEILSRLSL
jgi:hypothetical protein